jgi:arginyl-tRNA synthetase
MNGLTDPSLSTWMRFWGRDEYRVLVVLRSDGSSLYATKDLPLAIQKFEEYNLDKSIYVIDVRQSLYLRQIFKTLEIMGSNGQISFITWPMSWSTCREM